MCKCLKTFGHTQNPQSGNEILQNVNFEQLFFLSLVLYICVEFWLLAHLTRDLCQAEKKNVVTSWANAQNDNYFIQNGRSCHFVSCSAWDRSRVSWVNSWKPTKIQRSIYLGILELLVLRINGFSMGGNVICSRGLGVVNKF